MKILLVYPNTYRVLAPPPVGLSMVANAARQAGHQVRLLDLMWADDPQAALDTALAHDGPDLVGFSLRNIDNQCMDQPRFFIAEYAPMVARANQVAPTVVGGSALMSMPKEVFDRVGATYGLCGEATRTFPRFLEELASGAKSFETPGVMWRQGGQLHQNKWTLQGYVDGGTIDWSFIEYQRYRKTEMPSTIITKSGCSHRCLFCDAPLSFGECFVPRPVEHIIDDLERDARVHKHNRYLYFFIDACFNQPLEWAKALCEALIRSDIKLIYSVLVEPTADLDAELVALMKRSGCIMVTSLLGSVEEGMQERLRRPGRVTDIVRTFRLLDDAGIPIMPQLLLGGPGETRQTVQANFEFLSTIRPIMVEFGCGLRINPGTGLYQVALEEGVVDEQTDMLEPRFYFSPQLDRKWLLDCIAAYKRRRIPPLWQWTRMIARSITVRF